LTSSILGNGNAFGDQQGFAMVMGEVAMNCPRAAKNENLLVYFLSL
jgi:hypothetical protein